MNKTKPPTNPTKLRTTLALGLLLTAALAGCAKNSDGPGVATAVSGTPTSTASATAKPVDDADAQIKYSRCMRENGMTWFPDPEDGRLAVRVPATVDQKKLRAAEEACRQFSPDGGERPQLSPEDLEQARQMSKCMRENGVPGFPDPNPDGSIHINGEQLGTGPGDPTFDKAEQACMKHRPAGRGERRAGGPGTAGGGA